jgi:hypothetical protein
MVWISIIRSFRPNSWCANYILNYLKIQKIQCSSFIFELAQKKADLTNDQRLVEYFQENYAVNTPNE